MMCLKKFFLIIPCLLAFAMVVGPAYAVHDTGTQFELEGDATDDSAAPNDPGNNLDDWENVANGTDSANAVTEGDTGGVINDAVNDLDDNIFTGGGSKDDLDIPNWMYTAGKPPAKDDLVNAAAAAYTNGDGDLVIYFMADRYAVNGSAQVGYWFFQDEVSLNGDGSFTGQHINGDILILATFEGGGKNALVDVWEWDAGNGTTDPNGSSNSANINLKHVGQFGVCNGPADDDACAINNDVVIDAYWPYTAKSGGPGGGGVSGDGSPGTLLGVNAFFEGGINITDLLPESSGCFASFLAETRSSHSTDAVLKDFVLGEFDLCGVEVTKACEAEINAAGNGADIDFSGSVTNTGSLSLITELTDSVASSVFTAACIETGTPDGACGGAGDVAPPDLTGVGTDKLSFTHNAGVTVVYEGNYSTNVLSDTTPVPGFDFSDTVTAESFLTGGDPAVDDPVATDMATADCSAVGTAGILVTKSCDNARITGGDTFEADISGTVTNTGNVQLDNVTFSDNTTSGPAATGYDVRRADNSVFPTDGSGSLAPSEVLTYTASVSSTTQTDHANTITWMGENTFDASDVAQHSDSAPSGSEVCSVNPIPTIAIVKDCAASGVDLGFLSGILTVFVNTDVTVNTNGSDENLTGVTVSDPEGGLTWVGGHMFTCNSGGTTCTAVGDMAPDTSASFTQQYNPDTAGTDILGDLDSPDLVSFYNEATTSGAGALSGVPVGGMDDANCPLCQ